MRTGSDGSQGMLGGPLVPAVGLCVLLGAALAWALSDERVSLARPQTEARVVGGAGGRDVLTGREAGPDGRPVAPSTGWGSVEQPLRLRFVPSGDRQQADAALDHLMAWLRHRTGLQLEGAILRSYGLVVQEIAQGQCEVAFLTAASYARARFATEANDDPGDDVEAFLAAVREGSPEYPGSDLAYRGALIARVDSRIERVEDLTPAHVVALGNRTSGAGSILPMALFNELGVSPRILRLEGYPVIVNAVLQGAADVGCVYWSTPTAEKPIHDGRRSVLESNPDVFEKTRIIGYTRWIPNEPVVIRKAVPESIRALLGRAIALYTLEYARTAAGRARLESIGGVVGYIPATNADFEVLLEVIERSFANDPEGRRDFMERQQ